MNKTIKTKELEQFIREIVKLSLSYAKNNQKGIEDEVINYARIYDQITQVNKNIRRTRKLEKRASNEFNSQNLSRGNFERYATFIKELDFTKRLIVEIEADTYSNLEISLAQLETHNISQEQKMQIRKIRSAHYKLNDYFDELLFDPVPN